MALTCERHWPFLSLIQNGRLIYISIFDLQSPCTLQKMKFNFLKNPLFFGLKIDVFFLLSKSNMRESRCD